MFNKNIHHRGSIRIQGYDYSQPNWYYITICTHEKGCIFGQIRKGKMQLNEYGNITKQCIEEIKDHFINVRIDYYVVMPNHVHMIIIIDAETRRGTACCAPKQVQAHNEEQFGKPVKKSLPTIIRSYKSAVSRLINKKRETPGFPVWQRNYYEHIIRNDDELNKIRQYIYNNPIKWEDDDYYEYDW